MAHVGQELALGTTGGQRPGLGRAERLFRLFTLRDVADHGDEVMARLVRPAHRGHRQLEP